MYTAGRGRSIKPPESRNYKRKIYTNNESSGSFKTVTYIIAMIHNSAVGLYSSHIADKYFETRASSGKLVKVVHTYDARFIVNPGDD